MNTFGDRLRMAIKESGKNQRMLAEAVGVNPSAISQYCIGAFSPGPRTVKAICDALDINETWLRTGEGPMMRETPRTIVDELAKAYNLTPAVTRLLDALAQAFVELDEDQADRILQRLRTALAASDSVARVEGQAVREAMNAEGPDEAGHSNVMAGNQAE